MEMICFQIISQVGEAKSCYLEALQLVKQGKKEESKKKMEEGDQAFLKGHQVHGELIQKEASGEKVEVSLLLLHAEDQLMSAETIQILVNELVQVYER